MKFTFRPSPNYNDKQSTQDIMRDLTLGLLVVFAVSLIYYFTAYGASYGVRAIIMLLVSVVCAVGTEAICFTLEKKPVVPALKSSFPWVTAIILTMMCQINTSYYALGVSTIIAILFGKMVFGGFGQNIFNPAAFGRAVIMACFSGSVALDIVTGATPTSTLASAGWLTTSAEQMSNFLSSYGGIGGMLLGQYPGAIGETNALIILAVGAYLGYKKVIDWKVPVTYLTTLFVTALVIGLTNGQALTYALFHVLTGGAVFGAVFMLTDPVTNPTNQAGRIFFAMLAAFLTILIRVKANLPEGVLYSILLANMLTPAIERLFDGVQFARVKDYTKYLVILGVAGLAINAGVGLTLEPKDVTFKAAVDASKGTVYTGTGSSAIGGDVVVEVLIDEEGNILDVTVVSHNETPGIGTMAVDELPGKIVEANGTDVDVVSTATLTSNAILDAVKDCLAQAGFAVAEEVKEVEETVVEEPKEIVPLEVADGEYEAEADGFGGPVTVKLTVADGIITDCVITADNETPTIGGAAVEDLTAQVIAANGAEIDGVSGATLTSTGVKEAVEAALAGEVEEVVLNDGTYSAEADGFGGAVTVEITVEGGVITECVITAESETPTIGGAAAEDLQTQVVDANGGKIDGVTGATLTSTAVKDALKECLEKAAE